MQGAMGRRKKGISSLHSPFSLTTNSRSCLITHSHASIPIALCAKIKIRRASGAVRDRKESQNITNISRITTAYGLALGQILKTW